MWKKEKGFSDKTHPASKREGLKEGTVKAERPMPRNGGRVANRN